MPKLILVLTALFYLGCNNIGRMDEDSPTRPFIADSTMPKIKSGFYIISEDTSHLKNRKLNNKGDYFNGKCFGIMQDYAVTIDKVDTVFLKLKGETPKYHIKMFELDMRLNEKGKMEFFELTKKCIALAANTGQIPQIKLGIIIHNTLIEAAQVIDPISGGEMSLNGPYSKNDLEYIKHLVDRELHKM